MSYYMGDYYQGDPGFFSGIAGLVRKIPGIGGAVGGLAQKLLGGGKAATAGNKLAPILKGAGQLALKHPVLTGAGAAGLVATGGAVVGSELGRAGMVPAGMHGYHIEKRGKHAGQLVKNRHMRVTNPKALRRALRRAYGFERVAMRTIRLLHPKKHARFGGFKHRRKARV